MKKRQTLTLLKVTFVLFLLSFFSSLAKGADESVDTPDARKAVIEIDVTGVEAVEALATANVLQAVDHDLAQAEDEFFAGIEAFYVENFENETSNETFLLFDENGKVMETANESDLPKGATLLAKDGNTSLLIQK